MNFSLPVKLKIVSEDKLPVEALLVDVILQMAAQRRGRDLVELAADADREMIGAGERPQVAGKPGDELDFQNVRFGRNVIAECLLEIGRRERIERPG